MKSTKARRFKWGRVVHARIPNADGELHPLKAVCKNRRAQTFDVTAGSEQREVSCKPCRRVINAQARAERRAATGRVRPSVIPRDHFRRRGRVGRIAGGVRAGGARCLVRANEGGVRGLDGAECGAD